ncbi:uncharacterized protein [Ptychodera flava]|uniref:uncharacterized protein isoform X2 n=1 Tax=Ptychodera flava TaxID=63121 RepID=UPI00396A8E80
MCFSKNQPSKNESGATGDEIQETCQGFAEDDCNWTVVPTQEHDGTSLLVCGSDRGTRYVLRHIEGEETECRQGDGEGVAGIDMLNSDNRHCEVAENNGPIQRNSSGVTPRVDKRARSDAASDTKRCRDTDGPPSYTAAAMCKDAACLRENDQPPSINTSDITARPKCLTDKCIRSTPKQAWTWTNIDFDNNSPNTEEVHKNLKGEVLTGTAARPGVTNSDLTQVKDQEQSGDLLELGNTRPIVSHSVDTVQKPDPTDVNRSESCSVPEPCPSSDWRSTRRECAHHTSQLSQRDPARSRPSSNRLHTQNAAESSRSKKDRSPRSDESLLARSRKKSMLIAYDEGQLEIADDTSYRTLDIEADFELIAQLNDPDGDYVLEISPLKPLPEDNNNMSKGTSSSTPKPERDKKHSPPDRWGTSKRNSLSSIVTRRNSGVSNVSITSFDFDGKETKSPREKLQKLKKQISESILGTTKHKQGHGKKSVSDSSLPVDHSSSPGDTTAMPEYSGIQKVHRKDSGADMSSRLDDSDRTQTSTPNFERRPSLRRQRKLAVSPVENERIMAQLKKERTNSWSGSDDSGINNNQSRSSTDVSITEDDLTKESPGASGEQEVVRRRRPRQVQRRAKSDIGDQRWEDYGAIGGPPAPPPRTVTRRPISDPLMRDDNELGEVLHRERRSNKPRPKSDHFVEKIATSQEPPLSPGTTRYRPGSLAVIKDYGCEDTSHTATTPVSDKPPTKGAETEKLPAGSKVRRSRQPRPRPISDLGHINMQEIENYVQKRRYSGMDAAEGQGHHTQVKNIVTLPATPDSIHRSISTPSDLHEIDDRLLRTNARINDEDSSSGEDINSPGYQSSTSQRSTCAQDNSQNHIHADEYSDMLTYAEALWDHVTMDEDELAFKAGDVIEVTDMLDKDWWWGRMQDRQGWFPAVFVRLRVNQGETVEECVAKIKDGTLSLSSKHMKKLSISFLSKDQVRANVIHEIVSTEKIYVKHLRDVCEGYVRQCRKRPEMFSTEITNRIFGNIEEIFTFQSKFVKKLQACTNEDIPHLSEIGNCFLENRGGFDIYAPYCNNHPSAVSVLKDLYENRKYRHFFEACRLLQEMIEISLDGFLLTPVQKICKYPLQLAELLKYTKPEHKDYEPVKAALEVMKDVASKINEQKRRVESVHAIAKWQLSIEGWEGEDLLERSSILIHTGEVTKISKGLGRAKVRQVFLFDHQMVLCKRDLLNRNRFSYAGRVYIDQIILEDMDDGRDNAWGINVKNAFQLHNTVDEKWHIISVKTKEEKDGWIKAFADERKLFREDRQKGFIIPAHVKTEAMTEATKELNQQPVKKPKNVNRKISQMPFPRQLELLKEPQKSVTLPQGISSEEAFLAMGQDHYKKRTWNLFGTIKRRR